MSRSEREQLGFEGRRKIRMPSFHPCSASDPLARLSVVDMVVEVVGTRGEGDTLTCLRSGVPPVIWQEKVTDGA
jgi:hypothetical protein